MTIGTEYGTGKEFIVDTTFSVSMELEQYKAQKAVTMYTEKLNSDAQAAYKDIGEQNGRANKKNKKRTVKRRILQGYIVAEIKTANLSARPRPLHPRRE